MKNLYERWVRRNVAQYEDGSDDCSGEQQDSSHSHCLLVHPSSVTPEYAEMLLCVFMRCWNVNVSIGNWHTESPVRTSFQGSILGLAHGLYQRRSPGYISLQVVSRPRIDETYLLVHSKLWILFTFRGMKADEVFLVEPEADSPRAAPVGCDSRAGLSPIWRCAT